MGKKQTQEPTGEQTQEPTGDVVVMSRNGKTADVHPDEVESMKKHGWVAE